MGVGAVGGRDCAPGLGGCQRAAMLRTLVLRYLRERGEKA